MFGFFDEYFLFFGLKITYYGFLIAAAMGFGIYLACKNAKLRGFKSDDLVVVACYALPLSIICARVYYFIFMLDSYTSFWQIFAIWKGGLAIYGGIIGGALGIGIYCLIHKKNFFDLTDIIVPSLILGQAVGRWGNFFNGEAYGYLVTDKAWQWFPFAVQADGAWHLATFFYESMCNLIIFVVLMLLLRHFKVKQRGAISAWYLILYGSIRTFIEGLRTDSLYLGSIRVSQLLSIILIALGIFILIFYYIKNKKAKPKPEIEDEKQVEVNLSDPAHPNIEIIKKDKKCRKKNKKKSKKDLENQDKNEGEGT